MSDSAGALKIPLAYFSEPIDMNRFACLESNGQMLFSILFIFIVAIVNLCLGYLAATYLSYGPASNPFAGLIPFCSGNPSLQGKSPSASPAVIEQIVPITETVDPPSFPQKEESGRASIGMLDSQKTESEPSKNEDLIAELNNVENISGEEPKEELSNDVPVPPKTETTQREPVEPETAEPESEQEEEHLFEISDDWGPIEATYKQVMHNLFQFNKKLETVDRKMRTESDNPAEKTLRLHAHNLHQTSCQLLDQLTETLEPIMQGDEKTGQLETTHQHVSEVVDRLTQKFNAVLTDLTALQLDKVSPSDASAAILDSCEKLLIGSHLSRDAFIDPLSEIARNGSEFESLCSRSHLDTQTGLTDRLGLEVALQDWWKNNLQNERPLSVGLIDLDAMGAVNSQLGATTGSELITEIAKYLENVSGTSELVMRVSGQQFLIFTPDTTLNDAAQTIEKHRQSIEKIRFSHQGSEFRITVSAAVVTANKDDTSATLLQRLREVIQEAKNYGRNRTFLCESEGPTPLVPPELAVGELMISL